MCRISQMFPTLHPANHQHCRGQIPVIPAQSQEEKTTTESRLDCRLIWGMDAENGRVDNENCCHSFAFSIMFFCTKHHSPPRCHRANTLVPMHPPMHPGTIPGTQLDSGGYPPKMCVHGGEAEHCAKGLVYPAVCLLGVLPYRNSWQHVFCSSKVSKKKEHFIGKQ